LKIKIKYIDKKGNHKLINANKGLSLLEVSKNNNINLEGSCGGEMLCSTCHVYILSNHLSKLKKKNTRRKRNIGINGKFKKKFKTCMSNKNNK